jgi:hypothetical protein
MHLHGERAKLSPVVWKEEEYEKRILISADVTLQPWTTLPTVSASIACAPLGLLPQWCRRLSQRCLDWAT